MFSLLRRLFARDPRSYRYWVRGEGWRTVAHAGLLPLHQRLADGFQSVKDRVASLGVSADDALRVESDGCLEVIRETFGVRAYSWEAGRATGLTAHESLKLLTDFQRHLRAVGYCAPPR